MALKKNGSRNEKGVSQLIHEAVKMRIFSSVQMKKLLKEVKVGIEEGWFQYWERCNEIDS